MAPLTLPVLARGSASLLACAAAAGIIAGCAAGVHVRTGQANARTTLPAATPTGSPRTSTPPASMTLAGVVPVIGASPARLAVQLAAAERALTRVGVPAEVLVRSALVVQLACLKLAARPGLADHVLHAVPSSWRAAVTADVAATADLVALTPPEPKLPPWRIVAARSQAALRADYRTAQEATDIGWSYLAAINFVETDFGRIAGPSSAGAQGPMQFLPATWAIYGHGDIHNPRAAIMAAARFLRAHGGSEEIGRAIYAYNPSLRYVDAVQRYAARLRADRHAFTSYYNRQIIYRFGDGWAWLPPGYGTRRTVHAILVHP